MSLSEKKLNAAFLKAYRVNALTQQGGYCKYCLCPLPRSAVTADHRVPRKAGGGDHQHNIVAACQPCNKAKGHMSEAAFLSAIKGDASQPAHLMLVRFSRRMWTRVHSASRRIRAAAGLEFHGPRRAA